MYALGILWFLRVLCNANTYRSIYEGLFFNSSPALDLKYPLRLPYIHFYFSSLHLQYKINGIIHKYFNQSDWLLYFCGRIGECQATRPADNSDRSPRLLGPYVKTTRTILRISCLNIRSKYTLVLDYGPTSPLLRSELSGIRLSYHYRKTQEIPEFPAHTNCMISTTFI